ncbi:MAG: HAD family hydrolase [Clostridiales bacterium]|jgi:Cof subfamily protein (haloacid dehalogenase superfamily)|nr:HAD family hydrolase [Clostridiales bacterium]
MTKIKMIVCDLDQTLLRSDKSVSDFTLDILNKCRAAGIKFAVATARSHFGAKVLTNFIAPDALIYNGGAGVLIGEEMIYNHEMDLELTRHLTKSILENGYSFSAEGDSGYYYNYDLTRINNPYPQSLIEGGQRVVFVEDENGIDAAVQKITAALDLDFVRGLIADFGQLDIITFAGEPWVRIAIKEATKWNGVLAAAKHFGIETGNIAAFGDDFNDVEMLEKCGVGVAMSNAIPEAKAVANFVAASNDEDGVARWLEENIL